MESAQEFKLEGYEILGVAGEGGMATVYRARQLSLGRMVAIKVLSQGLVNDPEEVERFQKEAQTAAQLNHPGIVHIHDAGQREGRLYYVMEFVDGPGVADLLESRGQLPTDMVLDIAENVAVALQYAWTEFRLVHCDIKPGNIMVDSHGVVKITDLGVSRALGQAESAGSDDVIVGTPNYLAPEQTQCAKDLDCRTDMYALGACMYHMATGRLPFGGMNHQQTLEMQVSGFLDDAVDVNPDLSIPLGCLIEKLMVKERRGRPADWGAVVADIRRVREGRHPDPVPPEGISTVTRGLRRQQAVRAYLDGASSAPTTPKLKALGGKLKPLVSVALPAVSGPSPRPQAEDGWAGEPTPQARNAAWRLRWHRVINTLETLMLAGLLTALALVGWHYRGRVARAFGELLGEEQTNVATSASSPDVVPDSSRNETSATTSGNTGMTGDVASSTASANAGDSHDGAFPRAQWSAQNGSAAFQRGAAAFNHAVDLYENYRKDPTDRHRLIELRVACQDAIAALKQINPADVPPGENISERIRECYKIISDASQSSRISIKSVE